MKKIIKIEVPKTIWDADRSVFNRRPIFKAWMDSIQECILKCSEGEEGFKVEISSNK